MLAIQGLTEGEARARRQRGEGNDASFRPSRSYWDIARANLFTFFNNLLFVIGLALVALGQYNDALTSVGLGLINAVIGALQEINAKRKLDKITLLTRPTVTVVRDGQEHEIDPAGLVQGDIIRVQSGDQMMVDGRLMSEGRLELDESLLTGEPDLISKQAGDTLLSGSFCVTGDGYYEAEKVGAASMANQITQTVRVFQLAKTPLQRQIDFAVRLVTLAVALISLVILLQAALESLPFIRVVQISAVLSGQVPYGLFFVVAVAYTLGAASIAKQGALVQQVNAIESLSNVNVLCMDKTGTLTANRLRFHALQPLAELDEATLRARLGSFAKSATVRNRTSEVLANALPGAALEPTDEVPFASARKWSALAFSSPLTADSPPSALRLSPSPGREEAGSLAGVYVLGAIEILAPFFPPDTVALESPLMRQSAAWSSEGLRVLVFAHSAAVATLHGEDGQVQLPLLAPLAIVALGDELREGAKETIAQFAQLGIRLKIISGDNPHTVAALAKQAGFPQHLQVVSGPELAQMSPAEFDQAAAEAAIFGRITPEQKEQLVASLIRQGNYVAMMGDGVNDALSLKKATLGIAMQSGSSVTRNVADMILLNDSFGALLPALTEGQRIVGGLANAMYLFLARVATSTLIIIAISIVGLGFPYEPAQVALTLFTVGIPTIFLTLWARPQTAHQNLLRSLVRFVMPAAIVTTIFGVGIYTFFYTRVLRGIATYRIPPGVVRRFEAYTELTYNVDPGFGEAAATIVAQTALSIFVSLTAFGLILFLEPPYRIFTGWTIKSPDKRPALLALVLLLLFLVVVNVSALAEYFGLLNEVPPEFTMILIGVVVLWFLVLRTTWRLRLFERFLAIDGPDG